MIIFGIPRVNIFLKLESSIFVHTFTSNRYASGLVWHSTTSKQYSSTVSLSKIDYKLVTTCDSIDFNSYGASEEGGRVR